jgi:hypothetical protein
MNDSPQTKKQTVLASWSLIGIGALLLIIVLFFDPIGSFPDSGVIDFGSTGTKWFLGSLGVFFLAAGVWSSMKDKFGSPK